MIRTAWNRRAAGLATFALLAGCTADRLPAPDVAARLAGRDIHYSEFEAYLASNSIERESGLGSDVLSGLFDQFLREILVSRVALDRGLAAAGALPRAAAKALVDDLEVEPVTDEEVLSYYRVHASEFEVAERVHLRQILVEERAGAEQALVEIRSGVPFQEVARRLSVGPGAAHGGDQGVLAHADLPPAFAEVIFDLEAGQVSDVVPADYGYHLFEVAARLPAQASAPRQAAAEIQSMLERQRLDEAMERVVAQAAERYNLAVFGRNLPFNYDGLYGSLTTQNLD